MSRIRKKQKKNRNIIDYVLIAEFDINKGSTLCVSVPSPIPHQDPDNLADLMLPDGSSNVEWMGGVFFLNHRKIKSKRDAMEEWEIIPRSNEIEEEEDNEKENQKEEKEESEKEKESKKEFLHCMNLVHTRKDNSKRGATIRAVCVCSSSSLVYVWGGVLFGIIHSYFENQTEQVVWDFFQYVNKLDIKDAFECHERAAPFGMYYNKNQPPLRHSIIAEWSGGRYPVSIPITANPHPFSSVVQLVETFEKNVMALFHGVLKGERIIFLGASPDQVMFYVLSCCALVSPPLPNIIESRAFPYVNFLDISYREVPGYIAGTVNSALVQQRGWDLLANITTGQVMTAEEVQSKGTTQIQLFGRTTHSNFSKLASKLHRKPDMVFYYHRIERTIQTGGAGCEREIRREFQRYCIHILDVALGCSLDYTERDERGDERDAREKAEKAGRGARKDAEELCDVITKLKETESFLCYVFDEAERENERDREREEEEGGEKGKFLFEIAERVREIEHYLFANAFISGRNVRSVVESPSSSTTPSSSSSSSLPQSGSLPTSPPARSFSPAPTAPPSLYSEMYSPLLFDNGGEKEQEQEIRIEFEGEREKEDPEEEKSLFSSSLSSVFQSLRKEKSEKEREREREREKEKEREREKERGVFLQLSPFNTKPLYKWKYQNAFEKSVSFLCKYVQSDQQLFYLLICMSKYNVQAEDILPKLHSTFQLFSLASDLFGRMEAFKQKFLHPFGTPI